MATYEELQTLMSNRFNLKIEYFPKAESNMELEEKLHSQINSLCEEERFLLELQEEITDKHSLSKIDADLELINTKLIQLRGYLMVLTQIHVPAKGQYNTPIQRNAAHTALKGMLQSYEMLAGIK